MTNKRQPGFRGGDWFGCGRVITTANWQGFLKAQREYYRKRDAEAQRKKTREATP